MHSGAAAGCRWARHPLRDVSVGSGALSPSPQAAASAARYCASRHLHHGELVVPLDAFLVSLPPPSCHCARPSEVVDSSSINYHFFTLVNRPFLQCLLCEQFIHTHAYLRKKLRKSCCYKKQQYFYNN